MKRQWKRSLAAVLSVVMALSVFAGPVSAAVPMMGAEAGVAETAVAEAPAARLSGVERPAAVVNDPPVVDQDEPAQLMAAGGTWSAAATTIDISGSSSASAKETVGDYELTFQATAKNTTVKSTTITNGNPANTAVKGLAGKYTVSVPLKQGDKISISFNVTNSGATGLEAKTVTLTNAADSTNNKVTKSTAKTDDVPSTIELTATVDGTVTAETTGYFDIYSITITPGADTPPAPPTTYAITNGTTDTNGTVSFLVDGKAPEGESVVAEAGQTVTVVATPNSGYKTGDIIVTDADNGAVEVTNGAFTMPAKAVTVAVTFVEDSRTAEEILNGKADDDTDTGIKGAVETALNALTEAKVTTEAEAKAAVEGAIATAKGVATAVVTITNFTAPVDGTKASPNGAAGNFDYTVALTVAATSDGDTDATATITGTNVTIPATAYVGTPLSYNLAGTVTEMKNASLVDKTPLSAGAIWTSPYFTVVADADGSTNGVQYRTTPCIEVGSAANKNGIEFTTTSTAKVTITFASTGGSNVSAMGLKGADGLVAYTATTATAEGDDQKIVTVTGTGAKTVTYENLPAGTYRVHCPEVAGIAEGTASAANPNSRGARVTNIVVEETDGVAKDKLTVAAVTGISLNKTTATLAPEETEQLAVTFDPVGSGGGLVVWTSGDEKIAKVSNTGLVTAVTAGTVTITATAANGKKATCEVTVQLPASTAPVFAAGGDSVQLQSKTDNVVALTLSAAPADPDTIYTIYASATSSDKLGTAGGVKAVGDKITIALKTEAVPTADVTYYVRAQEPGKGLSEPTAVTVKAYVPVTSVALVHEGGQGEGGHTLVDHVIYEKLNAGDPNVIGGADNLNASYPNGWKLVAKVEPENATNKAVVFHNLKDTDDCIHVNEDGTVTAIHEGTGTLQVASVAEPDVTADFEITVKVRIGSVEIQKDGVDATAAQSVAMGETLALTANVTTSTSGESEHKKVEWTSSDTDVATVSATGVVTPKKAGTTTITATSTRDNTVTDTVTVTVGKGTPALTLTASASSVASGGTVKFNLEGAPEGVTPTFTVKQDGTEVSGVTVTALSNDPDGYDYSAVMPTNETGANVTYTVTAAVAATDDWEAAESAPASVSVRDASVKAIHITRPGATMTKTFTVGDTLTLIVEAEVQGAGGVKDEAATAALTYAWTKDGNALSATTATYTGSAVTQADADSVYVCTISSTDANIADETVTFTVKVQKPALASIDVALTAAEGVSYTGGALSIVGPVDAVLTIQTAPAGHGDTVDFDVDDDTVVDVDIEGDTLTVSPKKPGPATVTLKGTQAESVTKVITVTVAKAPAPTPLTAADITVTQPTTEGGKGTIAIKNPVAGTQYRYKTSAGSTWVDMTGASVEVDPGTYLVRIKVDNPTLQNYNPGVSVEVKAFAAAPTVTAVAVKGASSVKVGETLTLTVEVTMSDGSVDTVTDGVTWASSDTAKATVSAAGVVTGVAAGSTNITASYGGVTSPAKAVTVTAADEVDTAELEAAIADAKAALEAAVESVDGTDVPTTGTWITAADKAALEAAIAAAETVAGNADATQAQVNAAKTAVEDAAKAIKAGTKDEGGSGDQPADKAALTAAITAAETAAAAVKVSVDGSDVATTAKWITQADKDTYTAAIAAAKAVAEKADATQEEVTQAVSDLAQATTAFEAAQKAGTKTTGSGTTHRPSSSTTTTTTPVNTTTTPDGTKVAVSTKDGVTTAVVTVPSGVDKTTVTIPVTEPESGLVPVIVNADGTEEIVRMSVVTDEGVALTLDKSATVKLVNNAKDFVDVPGHWAEKSVDFTTARELFNGTDATHFTPNGAMTRGMMATVLFRLDGENKGKTAADFTDVADTWYTDAVAWAAESGVVNGYGNGTFLPEKSINREELAVMVYRYAKALGLGYAAGQEIPDLTYADAEQVSDWAYEAISWLTVNGVLNGKPGNVIDAGGLATRAEVSTVLERFVKIAK